MKKGVTTVLYFRRERRSGFIETLVCSAFSCLLHFHEKTFIYSTVVPRCTILYSLAWSKNWEVNLIVAIELKIHSSLKGGPRLLQQRFSQPESGRKYFTARKSQFGGKLPKSEWDQIFFCKWIQNSKVYFCGFGTWEKLPLSTISCGHINYYLNMTDALCMPLKIVVLFSNLESIKFNLNWKDIG